MQAISIILAPGPYDPDMARGRPSTRRRTSFGERVHQARQALGLSQAEVAAQLGMTQSGYAAWERDAVALRPDQLAQLAGVLRVSVDYLLGRAGGAARANGPSGKLRRLFEAASHLPRSRQQRIALVLEDMLAASRQNRE
jgi:transcriptional regulator with XRE-family HTH domain